jgi:two-component system, cell cycle sensor histidine kinase and response regulator CckA
MAEKFEAGRILRMTEAVMKAARGDYSVRIDAEGENTDLDALAESINRMIGDVRERITECRGMENAFREITEKYRRFQANIPGMVYLYALHPDGSHSFPYVNAATRQLFDLDPEAAMRDGTLLTNLIHPDDRARYDRSVGLSAETLQPWREELRGIVNGEVRWYECVARPEVQINGDILWDGIILEITERKRAEEEKPRLESQLIQAQKMESVGRLAGGVAHDFNNMLSVILGYADLIKSRLSSADPLLKDILAIEKAAGHSRDVTRQLLAFSRKQIIAPQPVDLNDLLGVTEKTLARLIGEDIDLHFYPEEALWKIRFDPAQMNQILVNLMVNARDAMPDGGKLTIETANTHLDEAYCRNHLGFKPGCYVLLTVSDNGIGMDREVLSHVFEPFFTTKEVGKGTGLGLATIYGIVKQNGGFINVYSEPGQGTTFKIYIPRIVEEDGEVALRAEEAPLVHATGRILLVEDDEMVREVTKDILEAIGYTVLAAETPQAAVSLSENPEERIDLLLTDVVMPGLSGKELSDRVKAVRPDAKVLFMSGYTSNVIVHHGILEAGVHFIQKPFSMRDLARKVRQVMGEG